MLTAICMLSEENQLSDLYIKIIIPNGNFILEWYLHVCFSEINQSPALN